MQSIKKHNSRSAIRKQLTGRVLLDPRFTQFADRSIRELKVWCNPLLMLVLYRSTISICILLMSTLGQCSSVNVRYFIPELFTEHCYITSRAFACSGVARGRDNRPGCRYCGGRGAKMVDQGEKNRRR